MGQKYLFVSDVHLGASISSTENNKLEMRFLNWLSMAHKERATIFLLGDIFDFWLEYKNVIPTGYSAVLGRLKEMVQDGIEIHFFKGNHDMWLQKYLQDEIGLIIHDKSEVLTVGGEKMLIGHGHDLCFKQSFAKRLLWILFHAPIFYKLARIIFHPDFMIKIGRNWSRSSRKNKSVSHVFRGTDEFITEQIDERLDYYDSIDVNKFIFGHFHCPVLHTLKNGTSKLMILGEWSETPQYGEMINKELILREF